MTDNDQLRIISRLCVNWFQRENDWWQKEYMGLDDEAKKAVDGFVADMEEKKRLSRLRSINTKVDRDLKTLDDKVMALAEREGHIINALKEMSSSEIKGLVYDEENIIEAVYKGHVIRIPARKLIAGPDEPILLLISATGRLFTKEGVTASIWQHALGLFVKTIRVSPATSDGDLVRERVINFLRTREKVTKFTDYDRQSVVVNEKGVHCPASVIMNVANAGNGHLGAREIETYLAPIKTPGSIPRYVKDNKSIRFWSFDASVIDMQERTEQTILGDGEDHEKDGF